MDDNYAYHLLVRIYPSDKKAYEEGILLEVDDKIMTQQDVGDVKEGLLERLEVLARQKAGGIDIAPKNGYYKGVDILTINLLYDPMLVATKYSYYVSIKVYPFEGANYNHALVAEMEDPLIDNEMLSQMREEIIESLQVKSVDILSISLLDGR